MPLKKFKSTPIRYVLITAVLLMCSCSAPQYSSEFKIKSIKITDMSNGPTIGVYLDAVCIEDKDRKLNCTDMIVQKDIKSSPFFNPNIDSVLGEPDADCSTASKSKLFQIGVGGYIEVGFEKPVTLTSSDKVVLFIEDQFSCGKPYYKTEINTNKGIMVCPPSQKSCSVDTMTSKFNQD